MYRRPALGPYDHHPSKDQFKEEFIPYTSHVHPREDLFVINGSADRSIQLTDHESRSNENPSIKIEYFDPHVDQARKKLLCVRKTKFHPDPDNASRYRLTYKIVVFQINTKSEKILHSLEGMVSSEQEASFGLASPRWASQGEEVYFLEKQKNKYLKLKKYDVLSEQKDVILELTAKDRNEYFEPPFHGYYMRESEGGERLFFDFHTSIVSMNISTKDTRKVWEGAWDHLAPDENLLPRLPEKLPDEVVTSLYGSKDFPVLRPYHIQNSRDYFFETWGYYDNWMGTIWKGRLWGRHYRRFLGVYDASRKTPYVIKVLETEWYPFPIELMLRDQVPPFVKSRL